MLGFCIYVKDNTFVSYYDFFVGSFLCLSLFWDHKQLSSGDTLGSMFRTNFDSDWRTICGCHGLNWSQPLVRQSIILLSLQYLSSPKYRVLYILGIYYNSYMKTKWSEQEGSIIFLNIPMNRMRHTEIKQLKAWLVGGRAMAEAGFEPRSCGFGVYTHSKPLS